MAWVYWMIIFINITPTMVNNRMTLYKKLFCKPSSYALIKNFRCLFYVKSLSKQRDKFDSRGRKYVFVGYPKGKKGLDNVQSNDTGNLCINMYCVL